MANDGKNRIGFVIHRMRVSSLIAMKFVLWGVCFKEITVTVKIGHPVFCLIATQPEELPHLEIIPVGAESLFIFTSTLMAKALGK